MALAGLFTHVVHFLLSQVTRWRALGQPRTTSIVVVPEPSPKKELPVTDLLSAEGVEDNAVKLLNTR